MKMSETPCYNNICERKPDSDNGYDYFLLSILIFMAIYFINVI